MDWWDVLALLGVALLGAGLGMLAPWLGVAAAGAALLGIGVSGAAAAERAARTRELLDEAKGGGG